MKELQPYLLFFFGTSVYCLLQIQLFFKHKSKVCGKPAWSKSISTIFPMAFAYFMSLCHILAILTTFPLGLHFYGDMWSVIFVLKSHKKERNNAICSNMDATRDYPTKWSEKDKYHRKKITSHWRLIWWLEFFSNKVFLN